MPALKEWTSDITAKDIMSTEIHPLTSLSSVGEISTCLIYNSSDIIPVVSAQKILRGCVRRSDVEDALVDYLDTLDAETIQQLVPPELFFSLSKAKLQDILTSESAAKYMLPMAHTSPDSGDEDAEQLHGRQSFTNTPSITFSPTGDANPLTSADQNIVSNQQPDSTHPSKVVQLSLPDTEEGGLQEGIEVTHKSLLKLQTTGHTLRLYSTPIQLTETSSLATMHQLFIMNRLSCAFVTNTGILIGIVKRSDVSKYDGTVKVKVLKTIKNLVS